MIRALARQVAEAGRTTDPDQLATDALARESTSPTGLPGGIAIPHCRTAAVEVPTLAFARLSPGTDFGAKDGPADLAFLIAAPAGGDATHLKVLTQLARALVKKEFTDGLRSATTTQEVADLVSRASWPEGRARRRPPLPPQPVPVTAPTEAAPAARCRAGPPVDRRGHRVPDRHRAHLHGRRGPRGRRRPGRRRHRRRDPGLGRLHAAGPRASSPTRTPRSSRSTSGSATGAGSPASRSSRPA